MIVTFASFMPRREIGIPTLPGNTGPKQAVAIIHGPCRHPGIVRGHINNIRTPSPAQIYSLRERFAVATITSAEGLHIGA
jgi:hypothetical protein